MTEISIEVELFSDNGVTSGLLKIQPSWRDEITGGEEIGHLVADVEVDLAKHAKEVLAYRQTKMDQRQFRSRREIIAHCRRSRPVISFSSRLG